MAQWPWPPWRSCHGCAVVDWQSGTVASFRPVTGPGPPPAGAAPRRRGPPQQRPATEPGPPRVRSHPQASRCRPACGGRLPGGGGTVASSACGLTCADGCNSGGGKWEFVRTQVGRKAPRGSESCFVQVRCCETQQRDGRLISDISRISS